MYSFNHPNILSFSGVCLDGGPAPYIIMPLMTNGSLLNHLKKNRDSLVISSDCSGSENDCVEVSGS
jgi:serine/threonine protein kinase